MTFEQNGLFPIGGKLPEIGFRSVSVPGTEKVRRTVVGDTPYPDLAQPLAADDRQQPPGPPRCIGDALESGFGEGRRFTVFASQSLQGLKHSFSVRQEILILRAVGGVEPEQVDRFVARIAFRIVLRFAVQVW